MRDSSGIAASGTSISVPFPQAGVDTVQGRVRRARLQGRGAVHDEEGQDPARSTTLNKQCRYAKRFSVAKGKIGSAKTVAITIRFPGNPWLAPVKKTYRVKVPAH
jgi:hypothetical protein